MSESNKCSQPTLKGLKIPQRWITVGMGFLGIMSAFSMRVCLSIAITEMTLPHNSTIINGPNTETKNRSDTQLEVTKYSKNLKYDWSEETQGLILSSCSWGYFTTCLLGGMIVRKLGSKHALGLSILLTSIFTLLTPTFIHWGGSTALIISRVAVGIGEGTVFPSVIDLLAHWIPKDERSKAGSVALSGSSVGIIFGIFLSGIILERLESGWPMVFYFHGTVGILIFLLTTAFCFNRPSENPYISEEELMYLKNELDHTETKLPPTPWRHILKSPAVWSSIIVKFGFGWGYLTVISELPKYMKSVLKFSAHDNGYLSSLPYLAKLACSIVGSWIADKLVAENILSNTIVRKIGTTLSTTGPAIFLVASFYAGYNRLLTVALLSTGVALMGCAYFSLLINVLDLSPNYASSIMGLGNGIAVISGALSPYIVGVMTPNQTVSEWQSVFWIVFAICVASNLVYLVYGSGKVQYWNDPDFINKERFIGDCESKKFELSPLNELQK